MELNIMTWEWKIGDPVDDANGGFMDAQNWTGDYYFVEDDGNESISKSNEYSKKAWELYKKNNDEAALHHINLALDLDDGSPEKWNLKGLILERLQRYDGSEYCYDKSLNIHYNYKVEYNKARMLYKWALNLIDKSKKSADGLNFLYEAEEKIEGSIDAFSQENNKEEFDRSLNLRGTIGSYILDEQSFQLCRQILKSHDKSELFTITGTKFYKDYEKLDMGAPLKLVKEPENEFDSDAIAVYVDDKKAGYVSNSDNTKHELTSSASELQDNISDIASGEFLFFLRRYSSILFAIGRIV